MAPNQNFEVTKIYTAQLFAKCWIKVYLRDHPFNTHTKFLEKFCVRAKWMIPLETVQKKPTDQTLFHQI